ncbi:phosphoserine phosphatase SerB [Polymorphobacter multimanifer]|uniref:phosphoserine phosphatase SerB n=1 Tax=Polymorphobacter multimanifer TaxID=1070431 RepID=UPI001994DE21|nr:phosphoserine phosphatase SerB [Polymorphobacter multimanifer]GGI77690.1 phosphoserine phosphatase SerB [Polymorphobacter multimanifer]
MGRDSDMLVTLVAEGRLSAADAALASDVVRTQGGEPQGWDWIDAGDALDLRMAGGQGLRGALEAAFPAVDVVLQSAAAGRRRMLLVADMDSTMIQCECIDALADYAGLKPQVAAITEAAMLGQLDFAEALRARGALLAGMPVETLEECRRERGRLMPGAAALVRTMRGWGARTLLVSGGFTAFTAPVAAEIGFASQQANVLLVEDGRLTGTVAAPIVDAATKRAALLGAGIDPALALAVGDGANDIPMIEAAGLGIAYHAKPRAAAAADSAVRFGDLTVLLRAQGLSRAEWAAC